MPYCWVLHFTTGLGSILSHLIQQAPPLPPNPFPLWFASVLVAKLREFYIPGKSSTTEPQPSPPLQWLFFCFTHYYCDWERWGGMLGRPDDWELSWSVNLSFSSWICESLHIYFLICAFLEFLSNCRTHRWPCCSPRLKVGRHSTTLI